MATVSPDGRRLAGADYDGSVGVYRGWTGKPCACCVQRFPAGLGAFNWDFSPSGGLLAVPHKDGVRAWWVAAGGSREITPLALPGTGEVTPLFAPDGSTLLASRHGTGIFRWPIRWPEPTDANASPTFGPPECVLAEPGWQAATRMGQSEDRIRLVDLATGQECVTLEAPEPLGLTKSLFSADGRFLLALGAREAVGQWDLPTLSRQLDEIGLDW